MHQGVGIKKDFSRPIPITNAVRQKELLIFKEDIFASAADIAPDDEEHPSKYIYTCDV